jgi:hypothetical protein
MESSGKLIESSSSSGTGGKWWKVVEILMATDGKWWKAVESSGDTSGNWWKVVATGGKYWKK